MNAQHTPTVTQADWTASLVFLGWTHRADLLMRSDERDSLLAQEVAQDFARHREQSQAELLEALEAMCAIVARHTYPCPDKPESNWAKLQDARAAIAKARGVQP